MMFSGPTDIREGFARALLELGETNENVVALTADLSDSIRTQAFGERFPERFFQMGVAESNMIGTAAGLALAGKIPFPTTFAVFATSLANQTVRLSVAYNRANVKITASHGGITVGGDGATHQAFEDIALMRVLPGMTVLVPADANEAYHATLAAAAYVGPVYLRLARSPQPVLTGGQAPFVIGQVRLMREGGDLAILTTGAVLGLAFEAAEHLAEQGVSVRIVHVPTVKPFDEEAVLTAARDCGAVVTVEEHSVLGGFGSCVAEVLARRHPTPIEMVGVQDTFGESGEPSEILHKYGLTGEAVIRAAQRALARKGVRPMKT